MNVSTEKLYIMKELKNEINEKVKIKFKKEQKIMKSISHVKLFHFVFQCFDV